MSHSKITPGILALSFIGALATFGSGASAGGYTPFVGIDNLVPDPQSCLFFDGKDAWERKQIIPVPTKTKGLFGLVKKTVNHCVDTRRRRSIEIVKKDGDQWVIANFWHDDRFWVAQIPMNSQAIDQMEFVKENFPSSLDKDKNTLEALEKKLPPEIQKELPSPAILQAAHTFSVYHYNKNFPIILTPQLDISKDDAAKLQYNPEQQQPPADSKTPITQSRTDGKIQIYDAVLSFEAVGQPGFSYNLIEGEKLIDGKDHGHFYMAYRMTSLEDRAVWMDKLEQHQGNQFIFKGVRSEGAVSIVQAGLVKANSALIGVSPVWYDTLETNCTNDQFRIIDEGLGWKPTDNKKEIDTEETLPALSPKAIARRGLIDANDAASGGTEGAPEFTRDARVQAAEATQTYFPAVAPQ